MAEKSGQKLWWHNLPAKRLEACTPDDDEDVGMWVRGILVVTDGDLELQGRETADDDVPAAFPVVAGQIIPLFVKRVKEGTTADVLLMGG